MENTELTEQEIEIIEDEMFLLFVRGELNQDQMYERINNILEGKQ